MHGFIKLHRKMLNWEWQSDPNTFSVFMHLLLMARFEEGSWKGIHLDPGQLIAGRKALSQIIGISEQSIRTCLDRLKSTNEITIKSTNKFSIITIVNWAKYQPNGDLLTSKSTSRRANDQPAANQQLTSNQPQRKNDENENNVKKGRFTPPTPRQVKKYCIEKGYPIDVERFVDFYSSKGWLVGKSPMKDWKAAVRNWAKRDSDHASGEREHKTVLEQRYTQRDYVPDQYNSLTPEEIEEALQYDTG